MNTELWRVSVGVEEALNVSVLVTVLVRMNYISDLRISVEAWSTVSTTKKAQTIPTQQFGWQASVFGVKAIVGRSMAEVRFASVNRFHVVDLSKCYREKACLMIAVRHRHAQIARSLLVQVLTYPMVQSPSWEANWFAASQEIPRISRNPKVHYRTHKRPPPVSILGQPNPGYIPTSHLLGILPNITYLLTYFVE